MQSGQPGTIAPFSTTGTYFQRRVDGQDARFGRVDNGDEMLHIEHAHVGDGEGGAFDVD
jgi:hypothetical protein